MTERLHFHFSLSCIGEEMATHSSVLAWKIPGTGEPDGLPSMRSHRVGHDWSDLAVEICSCSLREEVWAWHRDHKPEKNNLILYEVPLGTVVLFWVGSRRFEVRKTRETRPELVSRQFSSGPIWKWCRPSKYGRFRALKKTMSARFANVAI